MDKRAQIPVTLPRANPTQPFWQEPPADIADLRVTPDLPAAADVVIIGSGLTGAAVAWNLLRTGPQPPRSIVMLEARQTSSGATGRNGGHTKAASYRSFAENAAELGTAAAVQIARLELANIRAQHAFAREHAIACDSHPCHTVDIVYDEAWWRSAHADVAAMQAAMPPGDDAADYVFYDSDEVRARFHCGGVDVCGAVGYFAGSISAYRFAVGVLRLCLARGLNLQTHTAALGLERRPDGNGWEVQTERGSIAAARVVLATNGYTASLVPRFQGSIVPVRGQIAMLRPGIRMPRGGLEATYSFVYDKGYEYMVPRPPGSTCEGDIVIGGGVAHARDGGAGAYGTTDDTRLDESISAYLREATPRYFGDSWGDDHPDGRVRTEWTGIMGYTPDGRPFVGEMPDEPGLWVACGFVGHGMVYSWECARALVEMMDGRDGDELAAWFPGALRLTRGRMQKEFQGTRHTSVAASED